jgi:hypothetical protein
MKTLFKIFFVLLLFFACPKFSFANGDTIPGDTTAKYDLWDPRNPDCPCHQYQNLADEEYKKLQQQNGNGQTNNNNNSNNNPTDHNPVNNNPDNTNNGNNSSDSTATATAHSTTSSSDGSSKHYSEKLIDWKVMNKWMRKVKKTMRRRGNGTKRGNHRLATCFHWD